ncbi:MAG: NDP-sugar synthase [Candidatus Peribacteraceae bacterium]|jgi:glucose-1-phosphate thymidylyltransferase
MIAFILAGGFATRLWPLTEKRAKPLLPLGGKPLISLLVEKIPPEIPVVVSTNGAFAKLFETWEDTVPLSHRVRMLIETSEKEAQKMGALGALADWVSQERIDEDILLLTGDNYLGFSITHFLSTYKKGIPLLAAFDIKDPHRASSFGTVILEKDNPTHIAGFEEKPKEPKTTLVSTGCSVLPREILPVLMEFASAHPDNVGGLFEELLRRHIPVECFVFTQPWLDIGSFSSYLEAHRLVVGERVLLEPGADVDHAACSGSVTVGRGSKVENGSLHDCIIFEDCLIEDCVLRDCIVDDRCHLKGMDLTGKMLREGTVLERE